MGVGVSSHADVGTAGREAALQALSFLQNRPPKIVIVFSSIRFADPRLLKEIRQATGKARLIGCTDAGGITAAGALRRGVTVIVLAADDVQFIAGLGRGVTADPSRAGHALGKMIGDQKPTNAKALLMFPDGLASNGSAILRGVENALGSSLPVAGGSAGDDFHFQKAFQYFDDEIVTDSVPGFLIGGDVSIGVGVRHGWLPVGSPRQVTRAVGNIIYELNGEPAIRIYEEYLGIGAQDMRQAPLAHLAMTYPLGYSVAGQSEYLLRDALQLGDQGSLVCAADVAEGQSVRLMIGGYESALEAAKRAAQDAITAVGPAQLKGTFVFCSVARQKMLGSEHQGEIDVIRDALGGSGVRMGGFYGYGEVAPLESVSGSLGPRRNHFHNESVVIVTMGQP